jgi:formylmethanofuran dehydrogenase subunit E
MSTTTDKIVIREKIRFSMPSGSVDNIGQAEIRHLLPEKLPSDWRWETRIGGKGEFVGTLPKRIAKYFYQKNHTKLSSDLLGKIGSIMSAHTNSETEFIFDFTDTFDWSSGDFGDAGSCYWGCHSAAKDLLRDHGALAMRLYKDNKGYARAWLYPRNNGFVVFNGYGHETIQIARILASYLGLSYRKITLENNGDSSGAIWINGANGFVVDSEENVNSIECFDMDIEDDLTRCTDCGRYTDELTSVGGQDLCESCLSDRYFYCEDCNEYCVNDDAREIEGRYICESCLESYNQCDCCDKYFFEPLSKVDGKHVCEDCMDDTFSCDCCGKLRFDNKYNRIGDEDICDDCKDKYCSKCFKCGELHKKDDSIDIAGKDYCYNCKDCIGQMGLVGFNWADANRPTPIGRRQ